jgi:sulfate adenylyltransferase
MMRIVQLKSGLRRVQSRWFSVAPTFFDTKWNAEGKIEPHGGKIIESMTAQADDLKRCGATVELNARQLCDVELLQYGGFSPLSGFMNPDSYHSVVEKGRLPSGLIFGLPVVFDIPSNRDDIKPGTKVGLLWQGEPVAFLDVESRWVPDKPKETKLCYGTSELEHPGVRMVALERGHTYVGGKVQGLKKVKREFPCDTPNELRKKLPAKTDVVAFQCRNPIHRAHYELFIRALDAPNVDPKNRVVLVHPTVGPTQEDDIPGNVRYKTYEVLRQELRNPSVLWAYLPYSMHMAGPREALQHMMLRKNYGCTHFIIGRDMAGSKSSLSGKDYYSPYAAQETATQHAEEMGIKTVPSLDLVYTQEKGYITAEEAKNQGIKPLKISGTDFRKMLRAKSPVPEWFAFKSVVDVLAQHV